MESIQEKEKNIVGVILHCNNVLKNYTEKTNKLLFESDVYKFNMLGLYSNIVGEKFFELNESIPNPIKENNRGNIYSYLKSVDSFLNGYELTLQTSLNESLIVDAHKVKNPVQLNINTFKEKLKSVILNLEKQDDFSLLNKQILSIKCFSRQPIYVNGFDLTNNIKLLNEIKTKFNNTNIFSIVYVKPLKQLLFVGDSSTTSIVYDLGLDILDYYNNVNDPIEYVSFDKNNYLKQLKDLTKINAIYELSIDTSKLKFEYSDNLYSDVSFAKQYKEMLETQKYKNNILK